MKNKINLGWSFYLITSIFLLWNISGSINFLWQITTDIASIKSLSHTHQAIIIERPVLATIAFGVGVISGSCGCLLLLFKNKIAYYLFIISLIGILVTMTHTIRIISSVANFNIIEIFIMIVLPIIIAIFLVYYTKIIRNKYWT